LDLPEGMPQNILDNLKAVKIAGQKLNISHVGGGLINADKPKQKPGADFVKKSGKVKSDRQPKAK